MVQKIHSNTLLDTLCIKLPQMTGYVRKFEVNTTMSFNISNKQLLKKYNQIWKIVEKLFKIEFDSKPVYGDNDKHRKTNINIHAASFITNFQSKMKMENLIDDGLEKSLMNLVVNLMMNLTNNLLKGEKVF